MMAYTDWSRDDHPYAMEAGPGLDELVATEVKGCYRQVADPFTLSLIFGGGHLFAKDVWKDSNGQWMTEGLPPYSTDGAAALELVDYLRKHYDVFLYCVESHYACQVWRDEEDPQPLAIAEAETLPLAVCRAALYVVRVEEEQKA